LKQVIFAGFRADIAELLDIMDIFVFPTFREALGISVLEAMAMGKAIVATDDAAIPELITCDQEGMLVHPGDPKAIAAAVIELLNNPERCRTMGKAAKRKATLFSTEQMVKNMEEIYRQVYS
jgi:glycosyltransferase involved in cell wall biosynthesis